MNAQRRKAIQAIREKIDNLKGELEVLHGDLGQEQEDEQAAFDNLNEGLQASERGQKIEAAAEALDSAVQGIDSAMQELDEVLSYIDTAAE